MIGPFTLAALSSRDVNGDRWAPPTAVGNVQSVTVKLPDPSGACVPGFKAADHGTSMCPSPLKSADEPDNPGAAGWPKATVLPTTVPSCPLPVASEGSESRVQCATSAAGAAAGRMVARTTAMSGVFMKCTKYGWKFDIGITRTGEAGNNPTSAGFLPDSQVLGETFFSQLSFRASATVTAGRPLRRAATTRSARACGMCG